MAIQIKPLPFEDSSMEPIISQKTIEHHYYKHHIGYVTKLNSFLAENDTRTLEQILKDEQGESGNISIWNNAAQHYNHEFYWGSLSPQEQAIPEVLEKLIISSFGTIESFFVLYKETSVSIFGSGWCWLTAEKTSNNEIALHIEKTSNANFPKHKALLVLDVWEHAYYLDYQQNRASHIEKILKHLNWSKALDRLENN